MAGDRQPGSAGVGSQCGLRTPGWSLLLGSFHPNGLRVAEMDPPPVTRVGNIAAVSLLLALSCDGGEGRTAWAQGPAQAGRCGCLHLCANQGLCQAGCFEMLNLFSSGCEAAISSVEEDLLTNFLQLSTMA